MTPPRQFIPIIIVGRRKEAKPSDLEQSQYAQVKTHTERERESIAPSGSSYRRPVYISGASSAHFITRPLRKTPNFFPRGRITTLRSFQTVAGIHAYTQQQHTHTLSLSVRIKSKPQNPTPSSQTIKKKPHPAASKPELNLLQSPPQPIQKVPRVRPDLLLARQAPPAVPAPLHHLPQYLLQQLLRHRHRTLALRVRVQERLPLPQQLLYCGPLRCVPVQAALQQAAQARGDVRGADAEDRVGHGDLGVDDGHDAVPGVGDVGEGRAAVRHLVKDAAEAPDVAGLAQLHELGAGAVAVLAGGGVVGVLEGLGGHVVRGADVGVAVDVDGVVGVDCICDAEVDELEAALDEEEIGGLEVRVHNVVGVDGGDAEGHFAPVVPREGEVERGVFGLEARREEAVEVGFAHFHQLRVGRSVLESLRIVKGRSDVFRGKDTHDAERLLLLIDLPVEQSHHAVHIFKLLE